jgi:hypothetical protein
VGLGVLFQTSNLIDRIMNNSYHKKVDRSMMNWGLTIPQDLIKDFQAGSPVKLGASRRIEILWDNIRDDENTVRNF